MPDPFGRAVLDHHRGEQDEPLIQRDGEETLEHPIEAFYFSTFDAENERGAWLEPWLDGPLLDLGAGAGRHALYFQEQFETVAVEVSDNLVTTMRERGVEDARTGDMFALRERFDRDRFRSAMVIGTQIGLVGSMQGLRQFLGDLAHVTTPGATAVLDCYDPDSEALRASENRAGNLRGSDETTELLGYRDDPTPGLGHRVMQFEYEGVDESHSSARQTESDGELGEPLLFRLFSADRVREAVVGTDWEVADIRYDDEEFHYLIALRKR